MNVPYEKLAAGPVGALFEIDWKNAPRELRAAALDLDDPALLLSDGLAPSPADGRFHLQMIYAVCSLTYAAFQRALGRRIVWACGAPDEETGALRLRVRPFALKDEQNAYYDRDQGCLAFGWFRAKRQPAGHTVPRGLVFTGLSHDVIVHETTHALLDALRSEFYVPTNPDVLGFHEGFADVIALLQHFSYPDVVQQTIRDARWSLSRATLLTSIAREFGHATAAPGRPSALRSAVDAMAGTDFDSDALPSAGGNGLRVYEPGMEEHDMGSVLVSALFEAFLTVFRRRSERYFRIAGIAPDAVGQALYQNSELLQAVAREASDLAGRFLDVCIRAIDYCPPVDMELGEYLRAVITADADIVSDDKWGYRDALMRSFRRRRLFPDHVGFMTEDAVRWQPPDVPLHIPDLAFRNLRFNGDPGQPADPDEMERQAHIVGRFVTDPATASALHLVAPGHPLPKGIEYAAPPRVQSIRCARRTAPDGNLLFDLVAEVTQSCTARRDGQLFDFYGGCTLVIDPFGRVRYAIHKKLDSVNRQKRQHAAMRGPLERYWSLSRNHYHAKPGTFRTLHLAPPPPA